MLNLLSLFAALKGMVLTPSLVSSSVASATTLIEESHLKLVDQTTLATSNQSLDGTVASQTPAPGTLVQYGSGVTMVVYTYVPATFSFFGFTPNTTFSFFGFVPAFSFFGFTAPPPNVTVPNIVNQTAADANFTLQQLGLVANGSSTTTTDSQLNNVVYDQNPAAGTVVASGSTVSYDYYVYQAPATFSFFGFAPAFSFFGFTPFNFTPFSFFGFFSFTTTPFSFFGFTPNYSSTFSFFGFFSFIPFGFTPVFSFFGFFSFIPFGFSPFSFFGFFSFIPFSFFSFFGFTPVYATFSFFGFTPFNFTPKFSFFGFIPFSFFSFTPGFR